jgi:arylsulfatase A-like enzyme
MRGAASSITRRLGTGLVPAAPALLSVLSACLLGMGGCTEQAAGPRPNLLLVTVDTLRADRLACYGGHPDTGNAMCSIGRGGVRYVWAFSPAPSTAPAIASILTSRYPSFHGVTQFANTRLSDGFRTVAEELRAAGYTTAAFVSNPVLAASRNLDQGFEIYDATMTRREPNRPGFVERDAESTTDAALAWLDVAREPWLLWIHYQDPHGPYLPPGAGPARDRPGATRLEILDDQSGHGGIPAYQNLDGATAIETYEHRYRDEIRYLDAHVARLLAAVDETGAPAGVLLTADHGEAFGEDDYWFAHGHSVGLDQIRVPLLWRPPPDPSGAEEPAHATVLTPVSTIDVAPTLLAAAGRSLPDGFQGHVLVARDDGSGKGTPIFAEHRLRVAVLAGGTYYARDREAFEEPVPDRITGGWLAPIPPRRAALGADGRLPHYEEVNGDAPLEPLLSSFLDAGQSGGAPETAALDPALREQLRALGYLQ